MAKQLYETLGATESDDTETIKRKYRRKSKECHPDKGGDADEFKAATDAFMILSDPTKRAHYDKTGEIPRKDDPRSAAMAVLAKCLHAILQADISQGRKTKKRQLIKDMREMLDVGVKKLDSALAEMRKTRDTISDVADRITAKQGEENILAKIARAPLAEIDANIGRAERDLAAHKEAWSIAKDFKFRNEKAPEAAAPEPCARRAELTALLDRQIDDGIASTDDSDAAELAEELLRTKTELAKLRAKIAEGFDTVGRNGKWATWRKKIRQYLNTHDPVNHAGLQRQFGIPPGSMPPVMNHAWFVRLADYRWTTVERSTEFASLIAPDPMAENIAAAKALRDPEPTAPKQRGFPAGKAPLRPSPPDPIEDEEDQPIGRDNEPDRLKPGQRGGWRGPMKPDQTTEGPPPFAGDIVAAIKAYLAQHGPTKYGFIAGALGARLDEMFDALKGSTQFAYDPSDNTWSLAEDESRVA